MNEFKKEYYRELKKQYKEELLKPKKQPEPTEEVEEEEPKQKWIPHYKFLRDMKKPKTESNEIYKNWKKNQF